MQDRASQDVLRPANLRQLVSPRKTLRETLNDRAAKSGLRAANLSRLVHRRNAPTVRRRCHVTIKCAVRTSIGARAQSRPPAFSRRERGFSVKSIHNESARSSERAKTTAPTPFTEFGSRGTSAKLALVKPDMDAAATRQVCGDRTRVMCRVLALVCDRDHVRH